MKINDKVYIYMVEFSFIKNYDDIIYNGYQ